MKRISRGPLGRQVSEQASIPPPVGGWNKRDSFANMDEKDAVTMENWWPTPSDVQIRQGYTKFAQNSTWGQVNTVAAWNGPSSSKLFAVVETSANVFDITAGGTCTATAYSAFTVSKVQYVNFATSGGAYLYMVNGTDDPVTYNGTSWATANDAITGVTAKNFIHVSVFKERLFFTEKNTLKAWYLNAASISGTASAVDLSAFCKKGGHLVCTATWTLDAGAGVDDYWVAITSQGEVIVYQGTDPSDATKWALKGVWQLGSPLGQRPEMKWAGDILFACIDGVVPLSKALISSRITPRVALTDKIQGAMSTAASTYSSTFGWQMAFCPKNSMLLLNVPVAVGSQQQYAMNTITGSWGQFTGIYANCWETYNDDLYFGSNGYVGKFWGVFSDNGGVIRANAQQAFNYFGARGRQKLFKEARPIIQSNGSPSIAASLVTDYNANAPVQSLVFSPTTYATWDSGTWDAAMWGGDLSTFTNWQTTGGIGTAASMYLQAASSGIETHWASTDYIYEVGAPIG